jgi:hypothetical protein
MKELQNIKNKQKWIVSFFMLLTLIFGLTAVLPFFSGSPLTGEWPAAFAGIFLFLVCLITALIFRSRARKMDRLLDGGKLLLHWELDGDLLAKFADYHKNKNKEKNTAVMWVVGGLMAVVTGLFLFVLEGEEKLVFAGIMAGVFLLVLFAAWFFPRYYYRRHMKGDRQVLIGSKFAYINGYFHNWDYPLSQLRKAKVINKPFYGLRLVYTYTDLTWKNTEDIVIPASDSIDLAQLAGRLQAEN